MLYNNPYYVGHIFQTFLRDTPEILDHVRAVLSSDDAAYDSADAMFSDCLLAWLERQDIVLEAACKATLFQMADTFAEFASPYEHSAAVASL